MSGANISPAKQNRASEASLGPAKQDRMSEASLDPAMQDRTSEASLGPAKRDLVIASPDAAHGEAKTRMSTNERRAEALAAKRPKRRLQDGEVGA